MDWAQFQLNLQATLPSIRDRCYLIISTKDTSLFVQFAGGSAMLYAEAAEPKSTDATASSAMISSGWTAPAIDPNWKRETALPALSQEFTGLAEQCIHVLRDVYHIENPSLLYYEAWRDPEHQPAGTTWQAEQIDQLDKGEHPLRLPSLELALLDETNR